MMKAHKPLLGLSESPCYWWVAFKRYHIEDLGMFQSVIDPCLFFKKKNGILQGFTGVLVDDTISAGNDNFVKLEVSASSPLDVRPKETEFPLKFAGVLIDEVHIHGIPALHCHQTPYAQEIELLDPATISNPDFWKTFAHARGQLAYVATSTRPDVAFVNAQLAQVKAGPATLKDLTLLNSAVSHVQNVPVGIKYPKLEGGSSELSICGYADAAFANNDDLTSKLDMIIVVCDKNNNACVVQYASWKCQRVTKAVFPAELYEASACFDYCFTLGYDMMLATGHRIPILLFTDSKSLFDTVTSLSGITEKRLLIEISALRDAFDSGELDNIGHVSSAYNLTKKKKCHLMKELLATGKLQHPVN